MADQEPIAGCDRIKSDLLELMIAIAQSRAKENWRYSCLK